MSVTEQVHINQQEVDSLGEDSNPFEGPEKLLEIWFAPSEGEIPRNVAVDGLKAIPLSRWKHF